MVRFLIAFLLSVPSCSLCTAQTDISKPQIDDADQQSWNAFRDQLINSVPRSATLAEFREQLADESRPIVRAPLGTHAVNGALHVNRSNVVVDFSGFKPTTAGHTTLLQIGENVAGIEQQATGIVTERTTSLEVSDAFADSVLLGEMHLIKVGVNPYDPQEPVFVVRRFVAAKAGRQITYDRPFGRAAIIFGDYESILASNGNNWAEKLGAWGTRSKPNNWFRRGLGMDHGIFRIAKPVSNVELRNYSVEFTGAEEIYGTNALVVLVSRDVRIVNMRVHNPIASVVHWQLCEGCTIDALTVSGIGAGDIYRQRRKTTRANIITGWSAHDCTANDITITADDTALLNLEAGNTDIEINRVLIRSATDVAQYDNAPHFGIYGPGSVSINDIAIDIPGGASRLFASGNRGTTFRNFHVISDAIPSTMNWASQGTYTGTFRWGEYSFSPPETVVIEFTTRPGARFPNNDWIPYPEGIILDRTFAVETRDGITNFSTPDPFNGHDRTTFSVPYTKNEIQRGMTYDQYFHNGTAGWDPLSKHYIVSTKPVRIVMTLRMMRLL